MRAFMIMAAKLLDEKDIIAEMKKGIEEYEASGSSDSLKAHCMMLLTKSALDLGFEGDPFKLNEELERRQKSAEFFKPNKQ